MPDLETPEQFAITWCMHPTCSGGDNPDACCAGLTDAIRARDRQVREAMLAALRRRCRVSLIGAVSEEWLAANEHDLLSGALATGAPDDR